MNENNRPSLSEIKEKFKSSEFDRTFSFWSLNEDEELLRLYLQEKLPNIEISKKLRRSLGSIRARLKLHGYPNKNIINFGTQFANYIKEGINPITGELLSQDSAWLHPKILEDLESYIGVTKLHENKVSKDTSLETNNLIDKERSIFAELMINIKKFLPKISERDAQLLEFHYDKLSKKKTLQETAEKFELSRERVRQIRDKSLRKLSFAIKTRQFTFVKNSPQNLELTFRKNALNYLNEVLNLFNNNDNKSGLNVENNEKKSKINLDGEDEIINEINKLNFFRIETKESYTPYSTKNKISRAAFPDEEINKRRKNNYKEKKFLNYFFPITWEEVDEMKAKYIQGFSSKQLEDYFQRSHKSIYYCLEKEGLVDPTSKKNASTKNNQSQSTNKIENTELENEIMKIKTYLLNELKLSETQKKVIEIIYGANTGISFAELRAEINISTSKLQGILSHMTLLWRSRNNMNDRMWKIRENKYFPLKSLT